jgi:carbon-monoxide dehydrogenase medium subunit
LARFSYTRPDTIDEVVSLLQERGPEARLLAGGTDLLVRLRMGHIRPAVVVDLKRVRALRADISEANGQIRVGARTVMTDLIGDPRIHRHFPALVEAAAVVGSIQIRNRATLAGNICNASPAGDTIGACLVLQGVLSVYGVDGLRKEPLESFFLGPGKTSLRPGDIVTALHLPPPAEGSAGRYIKLGRNNLSDLAIVGVTVLGSPEASLPSGYRFRIALASVAPVPLIPRAAEAFLAENKIEPASLKTAARLAEEACQPIDDVRGGAPYRKSMVRNLTNRALTNVWERLQG